MSSTYLSKIKKLFFDNISVKQTILKNTFWLSVSIIINKLLILVFMIYIARILGATEYGKFTFVLSFVSLLMIFADLGLSTIVTREFAGERKKKEEFHSIISLKILLAMGTFILILLVSLFIVPGKDIQRIVLPLALSSLICGFISIFYAFFQAHQKMEYQSWLDILQVILRIGLGFYILFNFPSAENLSYSYFLSALIILIFVLVFFHFKFPPLKFRRDFLVWKKFLIMSWPLALVALFSTIYNSTDSVMLGYFGMITENGWYNAAYRITITTLILVSLISTSFYPVLSKFFKESKEKLQRVWGHQLEIMILFFLPLVVGGIVLAPKIIYFIYPLDFAPSILAFQILILTSGIIFLCTPLYDVMIASNQQTKTFWVGLSAAVINIILNLFLIPKYSLYGAAVATVITYLFILLIFTILIKKFAVVNFPAIRIFLTFATSAIAVAPMYFIIKQPLIYSINIFLLISIGAAVYLAIFFFIRKYVLSLYFKQIYN